MPDDSLELDLSPDDSYAARKVELGGDDPVLDGPILDTALEDSQSPGLLLEDSVDEFQFQQDDQFEASNLHGYDATSDGPVVWPWLLAVAVLVLGAFGYWWWTGRAQPPESAAQAATALTTDSDAPQLDASPEENRIDPLAGVPATVPGLADSDSYVRTLVAVVSSHPKLVEWLANDDLVRRFTLVISNAAFDEAPALHVPFLRPRGDFMVVGQGDTARIDPRSYDRYDLLAKVVASLDADGSVEAYRRLRPLIEEVYAELGYPDTFSETLDRALAKVERVPALPASVDVRAKVMSYEFADPQLEQLSDFQKQLLRMGPDNVKIVKAKVWEIRSRLAS